MLTQPSVDVLLGLQWGDEGKGKIVDVLCKSYDVVARFQGGPNAGHTLVFEGKKHVLHTIPSGIFHEHVLNIIGNGVVIDPIILKKELDALTARQVNFKSNLFISKRAHLILPTHRLLDAASESAKGQHKIGSTLKGIGPTYMDKTGRNGLRVGDICEPDFKAKYQQLLEKHKTLLGFYNYPCEITEAEREWFDAIDYIKNLQICDTEWLLHDAVKNKKRILAEGAQGSLLDIEFGSYPFVTSSNTLCAGACSGLGIAPRQINKVLGIFKAYCTRVGSGPFPTELLDATGEHIRAQGNEFGSTTGRARRTGWLDIPALKYAVMINGVTELMMMKADVLNTLSELKVCTAYHSAQGTSDRLPYTLDAAIEPVYTTLAGWKQDVSHCKKWSDLPEALLHYIAFIEQAVGVPINLVSLGPDRAQTLFK